MPEKLNITQLSEDDRPREKLLSRGVGAMTDAELLAILIGSGSPQENAVQLMQRVLADVKGNLNSLGKLSLHDLTAYNGIGPAKALTIIAACELGKRRQAAAPEERPDLSSSAAIYQFMLPRVQDLDVEEAWVLLLNQRFHLIRALRLSHGGMTETAVDVRVMMKEALLAGATTLALCHNHPSGNNRPSRQDDDLTRRVKQACDIMRIYMVDHIVVCDGSYYSYRDNGKL